MEARTAHAIVTGATGSLGGHLVRRLLAEEWQVTGVSRAEDAERGHVPHYTQEAIDLAADGAAEALYALCSYLRPSLIVHAAVSYGDVRHPSTCIAAMEDIFRVNANTIFDALSRYCEDGPDPFCSMIMVNSDAVFHASARTAVYAASKAALRVLTAGLADRCRDRCASAATLSLGPLRDRTKVAQLQALAEKRGTDPATLTAQYLRKSNPFLVLDELIDLDACCRAILHIHELGKVANGMVYRLDGGSAGSYI